MIYFDYKKDMWSLYIHYCLKVYGQYVFLMLKSLMLTKAAFIWTKYSKL